MANKRGRKKSKKNAGASATVRAGLLIIFVVALIWGVTTIGDPWYQTTDEEPPAPVSMADESPTTTTVPTTTAPEPVTESEPVTEAPTTSPAVALPEDEIMADSFDYTMDLSQFDTTKIGWSFRRNSDHSPVVGYNEGVDIAFFDAFYIVPTDQKVMYLTFDEGYENGYTESILNTLRDNSVHAAFFVTEAYIRQNPELTKRMKDEGHVVANHSVNHPSMPTLDYETAVAEIQGTAASLEEHTGHKMDLFFRPPMGEFSEQSLYITRQQGYKTIFWSMAYQDWYVDNQPGADVAYEHVTDNAHPGAVILLHAVSESNAEALDSILKDLKSEGYRFGSLYEIESKYLIQ